MSDSPRPSGFDAGWLFVVAGVAICAAGLLIPAQRDLADIRQKRDALRHEEVVANERLTAHSVFLADIEREDPLLVRRLAAAQLNLMPKGDTPVLLASSGQSAVTTWIDATVMVPPVAIGASGGGGGGGAGGAGSPLARLATGPYRLWLLSGGALAVFLGLLLDPSIGKARVPAHAAASTPHSEYQRSLQFGPLAVVDADGPIVDAVEPSEALAVLPAPELELIVSDAHESDAMAAGPVDAQLDDHELTDRNAVLSLVEVDLPTDATIASLQLGAEPVQELPIDEVALDSEFDVPFAEAEGELNAVGDEFDDAMECALDLNVSDQGHSAALDLPMTDAEGECEPPALPMSAAAADPVPTRADDAAMAPPEIETFDPFGHSSEVAAVDHEPANNLDFHAPAPDEGLPVDEGDSGSRSAPESAFPTELPFRPH